MAAFSCHLREKFDLKANEFTTSYCLLLRLWSRLGRGKVLKIKMGDIGKSQIRKTEFLSSPSLYHMYINRNWIIRMGMDPKGVGTG